MNKKRLYIVGTFVGAFFLMIGVFAVLWLPAEESQETAAGEENVQKTILIAGVDEAGLNTDMLMLCSLNTQKATLSLIQIPRDTYYNGGSGEGKINRLYHNCISKYGTKKAAEEFQKEIERALGITLDGYAIFDSNLVMSFVDLIGGVSVDVPGGISYYDGKMGEKRVLPVGVSKLNGKEAMALLRHRESYVQGDLGRLDVQMRFMAGVCEQLPNLLKIEQLVGIYQKILPNLLTNLGEKDIIEVMMMYFKNRSHFTVEMMRIPGEPCYAQNKWYYVIYRAATEKMLCDHGVLSCLPFDRDAKFVNKTGEIFRNIYENPTLYYAVYSLEEAAKVKVLQNTNS